MNNKRKHLLCTLMTSAVLTTSVLVPCFSYVSYQHQSRIELLTKDAAVLNTTMPKTDLVFDNVGLIFSIDTSVNNEFVKQRIKTSDFVDLPEGYDLNSNMTISNLKNTWDDHTIPFGMISFDITLDQVYVEGVLSTQTFNNVTASGFKTTDATTSLAHPNAYIYGTELVNDIFASDVADDLNMYKNTLTNAIIDSDFDRPIFKDLVPGTKLSRDNFKIISAESPNNVKGWVDIGVELNQDICWDHGIKFAKSFIFRMNGFKQRAQTKFVEYDTISGNDLSSIRADNFTAEDIQQYVFNNIVQFATNTPPELNINDIEIRMQSGAADIYNGEIEFELYINKVYNSNGILANNSIHKKFILRGFLRINNDVTMPKNQSMNDMIDVYWYNMSTFTEDILSDEFKTQYEQKLQQWLKEGINIKYALENTDLNGVTTRVTNRKDAVTINPTDKENSVSVTIYFDGVTVAGANVVNNYPFSYTIYTKQTPTINLNLFSNLSQNALDKLSYDIPDYMAFKSKVVDIIFDDIASQIKYGLMPNYIVDKFNYYNAQAIKDVIRDGLDIEVDSNTNNASSIAFNPDPLVLFFGTKLGFEIMPFSWESNISLDSSSGAVWYFVIISVCAVAVVVVFIFLVVIASRKLRRTDGRDPSSYIDPDVFMV